MIARARCVCTVHCTAAPKLDAINRRWYVIREARTKVVQTVGSVVCSPWHGVQTENGLKLSHVQRSGNML